MKRNRLRRVKFAEPDLWTAKLDWQRCLVRDCYVRARILPKSNTRSLWGDLTNIRHLWGDLSNTRSSWGDFLVQFLRAYFLYHFLRLALESDNSKRVQDDNTGLQMSLIQKEKEVDEARHAIQRPLQELDQLQRAYDDLLRDSETLKRRLVYNIQTSRNRNIFYF